MNKAELERRAEAVLAQLDELPTLSSVASRVLAVTGSDDTGLREVAALVESDPALSSKILALSSRADRGVGRRVSSVRQAATLLGLDAVRAAVLSVSVYELLDGAAPSREEDGFCRLSFWRYSLGVACAAELLAPYVRPRLDPGTAFSCGLLHAAGRAMLDLALPGAYARVLRVARERSSASAPIEREILGLDHHQAARRVFGRWGLPEVFLRATTADAGEGAGRIGPMTSLASAIVRSMHLGEAHDYDPAPSPVSLLGSAGVEEVALKVVVKSLHEQFRSRSELLGLEGEPTDTVLLRSIAQANAALGGLHAKLAAEQARTQEAREVAERRADSLRRAQQRIIEAERRAAHAEAMARLGEITAGAAHELNNPLAVIHGRAQILAERLPEGDHRDAARSIADAARRATSLITTLYELADPPKARPAVHDASTLFDRSRFGEDVRVDAPSGVGMVRVDRELVMDAMRALIDNARRVNPRGVIDVRAYADPEPGRWSIAVGDLGPGFSERALKHAFDAFFSDREAGRGVGLGLTRARAMIEAMDGTIRIANKPEGGALVTIGLPGRLDDVVGSAAA